ncbi:MAG: hypothetical protein P8176_09930, partial [Gammaproteobacteria bacterium]
SDVQKFFALPVWRGFSRSAVVSTQNMSFQLGGLDVTYRGLSLPGDEGLPKLAFYRFRSRSDLNAEICLIGHLNIDEKNIFTGFVSMSLHRNLGKSAAFVADKPLDLEASFDMPYLFEGNRGARYSLDPDEPRNHFTWLGVHLTSRGEVQTGSQGNLIHLEGNTGIRREWHGMTFDENAKIVDGCIGNHLLVSQNDARKILWKNIEFSSDAEIKDNQIGTKMVRLQSGHMVCWEGVRFAPNGHLKEGCRGNMFIQQPDGTKRNWEGVRFTASGSLKEGCHGNKFIQTPKVKISWEGVRFAPSGLLKAGCPGNMFVQYPDGSNKSFEGVTFNSAGSLQAGCRGNKLVKETNGMRKEWREVVFQSSGALQAGTSGTFRIGSADMWREEWRNVRFESAGYLQTDDNGITNGTYLVYHDDGTCDQWNDIKMSSQGRIQDGSDGELCVSHKNGKAQLRNYRFNNDYTVQAGSKGILTHIYPDDSKLHFVGVSITPDRQIEENNEMSLIREYPSNKCTLTWHEIIKKDGVYSQKGQKGFTCELASPDGQRQWFCNQSFVRHNDCFLDNHTGELVLLLESQEVARLSPLPHSSIGESSRASQGVNAR